MNSFTRYCKSYNFGHRWLKDYFDEPVDVEEKVDGSQLSFCKHEGQVLFRSRNRQFDAFSTDDLFQNTVDYVMSVQDKLVDGWTYRGEAFKSRKHNIHRYDRCPEGHFVLFDIATDDAVYVPHSSVFTEATRLGFEPVPLLDTAVKINSMDDAQAYLNTESVLGGVPVEGVVFKRRHAVKFNDRDVMIIAKLVSETFREKHKVDWKSETKTQKALVATLAEQYATEMRWEKAVQHLTEAGKLTREPKDIKPLIDEVVRDTLEDELDEIKRRLWVAIESPFKRMLVKGLPEWYKAKLAEGQFE